jgi:2-oxoglutarate dehydrogenase E2 component (dihydrolipoamide succinyltransferase)
MCADIVVPSLGESVSEATVAKWYKQAGDAVAKDEPLVELETDKVSMEVNAPADGVLESQAVSEDDTVEVGAVLGSVKEGAAPQAKSAESSAAPQKEGASPSSQQQNSASAPSGKQFRAHARRY